MWMDDGPTIHMLDNRCYFIFLSSSKAIVTLFMVFSVIKHSICFKTFSLKKVISIIRSYSLV